MVPDLIQYSTVFLLTLVPQVWSQQERLGRPQAQQEPQDGLSSEARENGLQWHGKLGNDTSQGKESIFVLL